MRNVILVEGPDGVGKSEIAAALSMRLNVGLFKAPTEKMNWADGTFKQSLAFDALLPSFIEQADVNVVCDRSYVSEWVYSAVFERETDLDLIRKIDDEFARIGAIVIVCTSENVESLRDDDLVAREKFTQLRDQYLRFLDLTSCDTISIVTDTFTYAYRDDEGRTVKKFNLSEQSEMLMRAINDCRRDSFYREERTDISIMNGKYFLERFPRR